MPQKTEGELLLSNLPDEVVFLILKFCDVPSLAKFAQTCQRFRRLADEDIVWLNMYRKLTVAYMQPRSTHRYMKCVKDEFRIGSNWTVGRFQNTLLYKSVLRQMPRLCLVDGSLWFTYKACIKKYMLNKKGCLYQRPQMVYKAFSEDISCFAQNRHTTVAAGNNGSLAVWCGGHLVNNKTACHNNTIHSIDLHQDLIVTGGRDATIKLWKVEDEEDDTFDCRRIIAVGDRVWTVAFNPDRGNVVSGSAGLNGVKPLSVWDIESGTELDSPCTSYRRGAGILCLQFENPHSLLSCGYDSAIRQWDFRANKCVREWLDPYDYVVYCLRSNGHNAILSGTCRHGLVHLWDRRMSKPMQRYYIGSQNSPVYSLAYNQSNLYVALERSIATLNFNI